MNHNYKKTLLGLLGFQKICRFLTRSHVRVFMYHKFSLTSSTTSSLPDKDNLEEQVRLILSHHSTFSPDEHLEFLDGNIQGYCPVVLTVDDGYRDFREVAYPVFKNLGVPVMLFVTTGFVSGETWFWWDRLRVVLESTSTRRHLFSHGNMEMTLDLDTPSGREHAWNSVADYCRFLPDQDKEDLISALASSLDVSIPAVPPSEMAAISWDQAREMSASGIHFGAHTVNHPILTRIPPHEVASELIDSQKQLESELGIPVTWFCYPQGGPADFNQSIRDQVAKTYKGAYVAFPGLDGQDDRFTLPRYGTSNNLTAFQWKLCGADHLLSRVKKFLGRPTGVDSVYWQGSNQIEKA